MTELWQSVFTPGPTPALLVAANTSFAALQIVLFALLYLTHSLHFVAMSVLCAGLWWAINWFAAEVAAAARADALAGQPGRLRDRVCSRHDIFSHCKKFNC